MSEQGEQNDSQDNDVNEDTGTHFDRGSSLSVFAGDRREDFTALIFALAVALGVYVLLS